MDHSKDYYNILGVDKKATTDEIKKAYRKKVKECHPDHHPGDAEKEKQFKDVAEAYETLSDESKRKVYDIGGTRMSGNPFGEWESAFDRVFNRGARTAQDPTQITNLKVNVEVALEDFIEGKEVNISFMRTLADSVPQPCPACGGKGHSAEQWYGHIEVVMCGNCGGTGKFMFLKRVNQEIKLKLKYGHLQYKCAGMGDVNADGSHGAVVVTLVLTPSKDFYVDPNTYTLIYKKKLTLRDYLEGTTVEVDRFGQKFKLRHDNSGDVARNYRLKGKGLILNGHATDLVVEITPKLPGFVSNEAREILEKLSELSGFRISEQSQTP